MILNNFLYKRSLYQNEQFKNKQSFISLVPKTTFNNIFIELMDFEKKEYKEEPKEIKLKKKSEKKEIILLKKEGEKEKDIIILKEEGKEEDEKDTKDEDKPLSQEQEKEEVDNEEDNDTTDEDNDTTDEEDLFEEIDNSSKGDDVILDNLKPIDYQKEGGNSDTKNVVVSFF